MSEVLRDEADYVIVGTGAGGATAARVLSDAGASVVMLEEGPHLKTKDRPRELLESMRLSFRDLGTQATAGTAPIPLLQGCLVGGSTAINSGIIWRMPDDVRAIWRSEYGLDELVDEKEINRVFEVIEKEMQVEETPRTIWGGNIEKMHLACERLGLPGKPMVRNTPSCKGTGQCLQGCPGERRQSMDVSYVPRAMKQGARLHPLSRVEKVLVKNGRAVGVVGDVLDRETRRPIGKFEMHAKRGVIVSAGALHTPLVLRRSGLKGLVGERFQAHPGTAVVGRFADAIAMGNGATQGYEVPMRERGFKLESLTLPPEMLAARLPGAGDEWEERLASLDRYAQWAAVIRMKAHGRVREGWTGKPVVRFDPTKEDLATAHEAAVLLSKMMFAAGAVEVYPGISGLPDVVTSLDQLKVIEEAKVRPGQIHFMASHLFGTACAGREASRSVVDNGLQSHEIPGLFVMDASVFPTNLGVNPQHSIMAVAYRASEKLANASKKAA